MKRQTHAMRTRPRRRRTRPEGYWRRRYRRLRVPREQAWRCRECGCTFEEAQAKRRRRGEPPIKSLLARTCADAAAGSTAPGSSAAGSVSTPRRPGHHGAGLGSRHAGNGWP